MQITLSAVTDHLNDPALNYLGGSLLKFNLCEDLTPATALIDKTTVIRRPMGQNGTAMEGKCFRNVKS